MHMQNSWMLHLPILLSSVSFPAPYPSLLIAKDLVLLDLPFFASTVVHQEKSLG